MEEKRDKIPWMLVPRGGIKGSNLGNCLKQRLCLAQIRGQKRSEKITAFKISANLCSNTVQELPRKKSLRKTPEELTDLSRFRKGWDGER